MEIPFGKKYVHIVIIITLLAGSYAMIAYVGAFKDSIDPSFARSFQVQGEGKTIAVPDIARFTFTVITQGGEDVGTLQEENTRKNNTIVDFIKSKGIDTKDIKTEGYDMSPRYQYFNCVPSIYQENGDVRPCPPAEIVGFTITQTVAVKVRENNFGMVGDLLSGVVANGATAVSQLFFTIDDPLALEQEMREKAIEQAKEKAKAIAKSGGFRLGRLLSLSEGGVYPIYKTFGLEKADAGVGGTYAPSPIIEPGSQEVTITVTLIYEIR
ncbi:MAG: SIMPL domain-containing protein [Candidatus Niyogibacteria bacterium]|nr:SIMPL domain-containing protein [Candidatus Niyogibacteria bacterium]